MCLCVCVSVCGSVMDWLQGASPGERERCTHCGLVGGAIDGGVRMWVCALGRECVGCGGFAGGGGKVCACVCLCVCVSVSVCLCGFAGWGRRGLTVPSASEKTLIFWRKVTAVVSDRKQQGLFLMRAGHDRRGGGGGGGAG